MLLKYLPLLTSNKSSTVKFLMRNELAGRQGIIHITGILFSFDIGIEQMKRHALKNDKTI